MSHITQIAKTIHSQIAAEGGQVVIWSWGAMSDFDSRPAIKDFLRLRAVLLETRLDELALTLEIKTDAQAASDGKAEQFFRLEATECRATVEQIRDELKFLKTVGLLDKVL